MKLRLRKVVLVGGFSVSPAAVYQAGSRLNIFIVMETGKANIRHPEGLRIGDGFHISKTVGLCDVIIAARRAAVRSEAQAALLIAAYYTELPLWLMNDPVR